MTYYKLKKGFQKLNYLMNNTFWKYVKPSSQNRDMRYSNKHYGKFYKLCRIFRDICSIFLSYKVKPYNKICLNVKIYYLSLIKTLIFFSLLDYFYHICFYIYKYY